MIPIAKILEQRSFLVPGKLKVTEHFFEVLRDYSAPPGPSNTLRLFARSAKRHNPPADPEEDDDALSEVSGNEKQKQLPWLLYLQGGPGFECSPPQNSPITNTFLDKGYQVLLLDQRGTGLSTPISASTLGLIGDDPVQAKYLKCFRADNIVRDCEAVRQALTADYPSHKRKWSVMGQSFGGFCCTTYLSMFPHGLREVFMTGGLPPMVDKPDEVYRRLFNRAAIRNMAYYAKFPEDVERVKTIVRFLQRFGDNTVRLPSEGALSARRFLQLGIGFGAHGGIDEVHNIVLRASNELSTVGHLTRKTLYTIEDALSFDTNLIYSMLHEPIYCQGHASNWSAQRVMDEFPEFDLSKTLEDSSKQVYFTGEMIFPFMFDVYSELRKVKSVAEILAADESWPALYDKEQLERNTVPVYAAIYVDDLYVDLGFSLKTAELIRECKIYVTNALYHNALRSKTDEVVEALWKLRCDTID